MGEPRATDDYSYVKSIKNTDEMGISSRGSLKQIGKNVGGLISYIELLVEGKGRASKTGKPLGNKFFVPTGSKCNVATVKKKGVRDELEVELKKTATNKTEQTDRYIYINNVPTGALPILKQMGLKSNTLRGLIPGTLENVNALDPSTIANSLSGGLTPACIEVELETINKNNHSTTEKHHVSIQDLQNMLPCEFGGKNTQHPVTGERCRSGFTIMNESRVSKKDNKKDNTNAFPDYFCNSSPFYEYNKVVTKKTKKRTEILPDDVASYIFFYSLLGVSSVLLYKLISKINKMKK